MNRITADRPTAARTQIRFLASFLTNCITQVSSSAYCFLNSAKKDVSLSRYATIKIACLSLLTHSFFQTKPPLTSNIVKRHPPAIPPPFIPDRTDYTNGAFVFVAALLAYLPALRAGFIWNDSDYVTSPALRSWGGLARIWTEFGVTEQYYPLLHSAFWLQHRFWGDHALGYHLLTLLAHGGGAVLFGLVLRRLAVPGGWLAAGLFALHPVHVESVAWISEQKNTLSLLLYLAAAWTYLAFDSRRQPRVYAVATGLFVFSLLTKTVTATLPAALLVVLWWQRGKLEWKRDIRPLAPWLLIGAAAGLLSSWVEGHYGGAAGTEFTVSGPERLLVAGRAFWFYLGSLVWPFRLNFIYPRWTPDAGVAWQWLFPLAALGLATGLWTIRQRTRAPLAAFLVFSGSLFPVLGFVALYGARYSWVWDHWQYLPDLGPLALAGSGLYLAMQKLRGPWVAVGRYAVPVLLALFATLTWRHSRIFHDNETLYLATLRRNPGCWMAEANLGGLIATDPARRGEAITRFTAALRLKPDSAEIHESLANLLAQDPAETTAAREHYQTALRLNPNLATAHNNYGLLLYRAGESNAAIAEFRRALACNPHLATAGANLGTVLSALNRPAEALPILQTALAADPTLAATHFALGNVLAALARPSEAESAFRSALSLDPNAVDIRVGLAGLLLNSQNISEAVNLLQQAIARDATSAEAHYHLGGAQFRLGNTTEGMRELREATRLRPQWAAAHLTLGNMLAETRDINGAIREFRAALAIRPEDTSARNNLANALLVAGATAEATLEYEEALRQQPGNQDIRANLEFAREQLRSGASR